MCLHTRRLAWAFQGRLTLVKQKRKKSIKLSKQITTHTSVKIKDPDHLSYTEKPLENNSGLLLNYMQETHGANSFESTSPSLNKDMGVLSDISQDKNVSNSSPVLYDSLHVQRHKLETIASFDIDMNPLPVEDKDLPLLNEQCEDYYIGGTEEVDRHMFFENHEAVDHSAGFDPDTNVLRSESPQSHLQVGSSQAAVPQDELSPGDLEVAKSGQKQKKVSERHSKHHSTHNMFMKRLAADEQFRNMMNMAFVDACCYTGNERTAFRNIMFQSNRHKITSVSVFNRLIRTFAKKKDITMVQRVISALKQQGLKPNHQTYAGYLECIGRMHAPDGAHVVGGIFADAEQNGLDIADIPKCCHFEGDEWPCILDAIYLVCPNFTPNPADEVECYDNELLTGLNRVLSERVEQNQYAVERNEKTLLMQLDRQFQREQKHEVVVKSIWTSDTVQDAKTKHLKSYIMGCWRKKLSESFKRKLANYEKRFQDNWNLPLYPYLTVFPSKDYVDIVFNCLKQAITGHYSPTQTGLQYQLGQAVNAKYNIEHRVGAGLDKRVRDLYTTYMLDFNNKDRLCDNHRLMFLRAMHENPETINLDFSHKKWPSFVIKGVGKFLLDMVLYDLKIDANLLSGGSQRLVPAFSNIFRPDIAMTSTQEVKLHPVVQTLFEGNFSEPFSFPPSAVPMLVPPMPWMSEQMGSLLLGSCDFIRLTASTGFVDALKGIDEKQYSGVLDSLNTLGACAWKLNKPILELQIDIFNNKGDYAKLKVPQQASALPPLPTVTQDMNKKVRAQVYRERVKELKERQEMHGLWCTELYRLSIANKYKNEIFWFPHSIDFRGRAYPVPPHFNHLGNDNVRGLLLLAKGKPLEKHGHDWLKIHLTNLTGQRKRSSNQERLEYANSMMDEILDSADYPMTGRKWWQESEEPWQTLACCKELAKIARFDGKVEDYICHFPVHQDGSCNGLQHYAALGRDQAGAESVNLHPFENPRDVYSDVVELVEEQRKQDADRGIVLAKRLEGVITRKVIKPTVMTTVYGVTTFGARAQILKGLSHLEDTKLAFNGALYLTRSTFKSLQAMFTATKDIQDWLTVSARQISAFAAVEWVTPLGFPVLQPYYKLDKGTGSRSTFKVNTLKQKNGFAANYIHSLDSTHMMLTSLYCQQAGITFVSVHDCFWTHPCDVPIMNKICREQFVHMHKQPLLENLSVYMMEHMRRAFEEVQMDTAKNKALQYQFVKLAETLQAVPERGTFDLDNVIKSVYFFS